VVAVLALVATGAILWSVPALFVPLMTRVAYVALGVRAREAMVDGRAWGYLECGPVDGVPILMLHGFGTSREAMMSMMPWLENSHRCIAPDLPGFGRHPFHQGEAHDADFYARETIRFADALGVRRFDLLGTSMGGALAVHIAALHPDRVRRLVLLAPAGVQAPVRNEFMRSIDRGENPLDIASEDDFDRVIGLVFARRPPVPWQFRSYMVGEALRRRPDTLRIVEAIKPFLLDGVRPELPQVRAPTLVVWGDSDRVTDRSMLGVFTAGIPGATASLVRDAGHVVFSDAPDEVRRTIVPFLQVADRP
jgi:pimeloyl-ACP methyl ester carboxylesterase